MYHLQKSSFLIFFSLVCGHSFDATIFIRPWSSYNFIETECEFISGLCFWIFSLMWLLSRWIHQINKLMEISLSIVIFLQFYRRIWHIILLFPRYFIWTSIFSMSHTKYPQKFAVLFVSRIHKMHCVFIVHKHIYHFGKLWSDSWSYTTCSIQTVWTWTVERDSEVRKSVDTTKQKKSSIVRVFCW